MENNRVNEQTPATNNNEAGEENVHLAIPVLAPPAFSLPILSAWRAVSISAIMPVIPPISFTPPPLNLGPSLLEIVVGNSAPNRLGSESSLASPQSSLAAVVNSLRPRVANFSTFFHLQQASVQPARPDFIPISQRRSDNKSSFNESKINLPDEELSVTKLCRNP